MSANIVPGMKYHYSNTCSRCQKSSTHWVPFGLNRGWEAMCLDHAMAYAEIKPMNQLQDKVRKIVHAKQNL